MVITLQTLLECWASAVLTSEVTLITFKGVCGQSAVSQALASLILARVLECRAYAAVAKAVSSLYVIRWSLCRFFKDCTIPVHILIE